MLDPNNEFNVDRTLTKDDVQKLIKVCVDRLLDSRSPALDTVKMQVYFDMNYTTRGKMRMPFSSGLKGSDFLTKDQYHITILKKYLEPVDIICVIILIILIKVSLQLLHHLSSKKSHHQQILKKNLGGVQTVKKTSSGCPNDTLDA